MIDKTTGETGSSQEVQNGANCPNIEKKGRCA